MAALLERPVIARRLARLFGTPELSPLIKAQLIALAALHDIGKVNGGFQRAPFPGGERSPGHVKPVLALFEALFASRRDREFVRFASDGRLDAVQHLLVMPPLYAVMAHHGELPDVGQSDARTDLWRKTDGYDPAEACRTLIAAIAEWLPDALRDEAPMWSEPFGHAFAGLLMLADWIGSDSARFAFPDRGAPDGARRFAWALTKAREALLHRRLAPELEREIASRLAFDCQTLTKFPEPSAAQRAMLDLAQAPSGRICLIEDETGSGKTEAALIHFIDLFRQGEVDGLYFALPTRAAARQIHGRIEQALQRLIDPAIRVTLAIPGYAPFVADELLPDPQVLLDDDARAADRDAQWATERPKRFLASLAAVGTIDQALMGTLRVRHAQLRSSLLLRSLLVVDEVHASDPYMVTILRSLLAQHRRAGGHALLMSATLGSAARARLLRPGASPRSGDFATEAARPYPAIWSDAAPDAPSIGAKRPHAQKRVRIDLEPDWQPEGAVVHMAAEAARRGARVLVIRNTVALVVATQAALEAAGAPLLEVATPCGAVLAPHHARFAPEDRAVLDAALEAALGKGAARDAGRIVVASQTAEQSLDIDADLLVTDLCPADVLLQRIGRLHRHVRPRPPGFEAPRCVVLAPSESALGTTLVRGGDVANALLGLGLIYPSLLGIVATRRALEQSGTISIPRDNRSLVERATHPTGLHELGDELGGMWADRWEHEYGTSGAQIMAANNACLKWSCPIQPIAQGIEEKIATRLGLEDRSIALPAGTVGPFGQAISRLVLSGRWVKGIAPETTISLSATARGAFSVSYGERAFIYNRYGLHLM